MRPTYKHNNEVEKALSLLERIDPQYRGYRLLLGEAALNEADSRLKQVDRIIDQAFAGMLNPDAVVTGEEYYVNGNPNTTWRQYLLFNLRHTFGLMTNADVKYLPVVARLAYSDEVKFDMTNSNGQQVNTLRRIVEQLKKNPSLFEEIKKTPNITFGQLSQRFSNTFAQEDRKDAEAANSVQTGNSNYSVVEVPDFETARYYGVRSCSTSKLCYTTNERTWNGYTNGGMNRVYVCLRNGWENIPEKATEGNPYDLYGTSMIFVFIGPDGNLVSSNCRWNHGNVGKYQGDVDHAFTKATLSQTIGIPFDSVFKPWNFDECKLIQMIEYGNAPKSLCNGDIVIPDGARCIGKSTFNGCYRLTSVTIPNSVTEIGMHAFSDCYGLSSVTIGNSVTKIDGDAFSGCDGLRSLTIPNSVTYIGRSAFEDCTGLTSVVIGNSVKIIDNYAFRGCTNLTSVTIPISVNKIGYSAFSHCNGLTIYVEMDETANMLRQSGFEGQINRVNVK